MMESRPRVEDCCTSYKSVDYRVLLCIHNSLWCVFLFCLCIFKQMMDVKNAIVVVSRW